MQDCYQMRKSASWMTVWDDRILEVLLEMGPAPVKELTEHKYIRVSQSTVSRRLKKLTENGLVIAVGNGVYMISDQGEAYLEEEYDAEEGVYLTDGQPEDGPTAAEGANDI